MFRHRRNSQKPNDALLAAFKQNFPNLNTTSGARPENTKAATASHRPEAGAAIIIDEASRQDESLHDYAALGETDLGYSGHHHAPTETSQVTPSRFAMDQWRLTPSLFDPSAFGMGHLGGGTGPGQHLPYDTTNTPGGAGINNIYHNQAAGDLHTPSLAFQLGTPLSMPLEGSLHTSGAFDQSFNPQMFTQHGFDTDALFHQQTPEDHDAQQHLAPGNLLVHKDSGIGGSENSPVPGMHISADLASSLHGSDFEHKPQPASTHPSLKRFRYHVTLNAQTAMVRNQDEVPMTYLNKGQAYGLSIVDSLPHASPPRNVRYRTTIRVSFEEAEQRSRPAQCWQLWKEGRGVAEARQRGGRLQAVEYVDPHPGAAEDDPRKSRISIESESFDGFTVDWSPAVHATSPVAECAVAVRFNFLSTDFSHSKGVKGVPVRLCAKTYLLGNIQDGELQRDPGQEHPPDAEVVYCKVKLFRDHGAERKLTNDVAHVKKSIERLKNQIQQRESGVRDSGRRKRTSMSLGKIESGRPAKIPKHRRTWSVSSTGSGGGKPAVEVDMNDKLVSLQDMFGSTRTVSILFLQGDPEDDMDAYPITLPGNVGLTGMPGEDISDGSQMGSPEQSPTADSQNASGDLASTGPKRVHRGSHVFEATGTHPGYRAPIQSIKQAVACFYVRQENESPFYKAVYLWSRTARELCDRLRQKFDVSSNQHVVLIRVLEHGIETELDDDTVAQTEEGQDMTLELEERNDVPVKHETPPTSLQPRDPGGTLAMKLKY